MGAPLAADSVPGIRDADRAPLAFRYRRLPCTATAGTVARFPARLAAHVMHHGLESHRPSPCVISPCGLGGFRDGAENPFRHPWA